MTPSGTTTRRFVSLDASPDAVREFLRALGQRHTYQLFKNTYAIFGLLWSLPIPFYGVLLQLWFAGRIVSYPLTIFFALHPILFVVVFGAMGTVRAKKDAEIRRLLEALRVKVEALAEANEKLKELDVMKGELISNVTHELKTPLVSVRGYTEMMFEGRLGPTTEQQLRGLKTSLRNIDRLQRLIDDLLMVGRLESNRLNVRPAPFDLGPAVKSVVESLRPQLEDRRGDIHLPPGPLSVCADVDLITRALANLLSNAVKFTKPGGLIRVACGRRENRAYVRVEDDGCGIPADQQAHLYERFWRAGAVHAAGTGLGLAITKGILDAHGSHITLMSEVGKGTTVEFDLPLAAEGGVSHVAEAAHSDRR